MTTIAYKDGVLACDSKWSHSGVQVTSLSKIDRLPNGLLVAAAGDGDIRDLLKMLAEVKTPDDLPKRQELAALELDIRAIVAFPDGQIWQITIDWMGNVDRFEAQVFPTNMPCLAIGSGGEIALGAMLAGKSAAEAVEIACSADNASGLPVHVVQLHTSRAPRVPTSAASRIAPGVKTNASQKRKSRRKSGT